MKKLLVIALIVAAAAILAFQVQSVDQKTHQYRCQDRNQSLYFVIYEVDGKIDRGHMYFENIQVANLEAYRMNSITNRAKVKGNSADVELGFNKSRKLVFVANKKTGTTEDRCTCTYNSR